MSDIAVISRVSSGAIDGRLRILRVRQRLFRSFHEALIKHHGDLLKAVQADDGCLKAEAQAVLAGALIELRNHYDLLDFETDLELEYSLARRKSRERRRKAIALTYIIPNPFNLLYNVVSVLSAALEAGSCVIVELENTTQKTPVLLRRIILESLDRDAFGVVSSRAPTKILAQCVVIDQKPMSHNNISAQRVISTPEYRSVAVVDRTGDTNLAAKEIVASRLIFGGSSSYAVDLVLVNEFVAKGFQEAVSREMAKPGWEGQRTTGQSCESRRPNIVESTEAALFDEQVKSGKVTFVEGDSSKGAVQILDRNCWVAQRKLSGSCVVVFATITSLDDSIDFLSTGIQQSTPIGALYLFTAHREAKYLSQYIDSRATYVNHVPAQISIGPMAPKDYSTNLRTRYTSDMFELPSPEIVPGSGSHLVSSLLEKVDSFDRVAQKPLKPTGQPPSGAWGFFEQGIILGAIVYILPMMGVITFGLGYAGWISDWKAWR